MRRSNSCSTPITVRNPDVAQLAPGFNLVNISKAWQYSTGNGVPVAVIDTGVSPNPRLPVVPGGDYIMGEDGLSDCDAHGTVVSSIIAAAPLGILPMPRAMPATAAFPPPAGPPPVTAAPAPPVEVPPPMPPPPPVTITQTVAPPPPPPEDAGAMAPSNGPPDPQTEDEPAVPPPPPGAPDGVVGVAPHATIISIRQSSRAFEPVNPSSAGPNSDEKVKAGTLDSVARAVVHAANMGAKVINISVTACLPAAAPGDQRVLGAALWYAATVKDAVIVAAAGNDGEAGCGNNPMYDPLDPSDPRDWHQVTVVSSPSWFSDYVLSVGAVDAYGAALDKSMSGPWVGVAAPGTHIMGLSPQGGGPVNAYPPSRPGEKNMPFWGTSFSAAYVSGVAALVRAKFPELTAYQVINRIVQSAHNPPAGVDNKLGYGLVDPVAALTFNIPSGDRMAPGAQSRVITPAAPPPPPDHRARNIAIGFVGAVATGNGNRGSATEGALTSKLTGFSPRSARRVAGVWTVFVLASAGWALGGQLGAVMAVVVGVALVFVQWWGQPAWSWAVLGLRGRRPVKWNDPITLANNRSGGGVRVQDGVAVVAVQLLGRAHRATTVTGSVTVESDNVIDVVELAPLLRHPLDLELDSISVVTFGSRTGTVGDYPRVYDAEIGTPPYAGRRETWLIMRLPVIGNTQALRWRTSVGAAAISVAQRVASSLRCQGLRAKLATATDLAELDRRLGSDAVAGSAQRWKAIRGEAGWMTTYAYPAEAISSRVLSQAWTLRADEVIQNVTVYPDATCTATITVRTPTPAPTPPSVILRRLNGEQAAAAAANMCGPRPHLRGQRRCPLPAQLVTEIGPSGVLIGKLSNGDRLMIPVTDAGELSRVFVAADDTIAKRIVIRVVGAGERVCVHTRDQERWASVRMPQLSIVGTPRPAPRTTVGVVEYVRRRKNGDDGKSEGSGVDVAISPTPRPASVITIARPGTSLSESDRHGFEVTIEQIDRATVKVGAAGQNWLVEMEMFRAENRYVSLEPVTMSIGR